jgi:hypothetical protein
MSKRVSTPPRIAPLQRVIAEAITDAVEQAALDKLHKRQKRTAKPGSKPAAKKRA